MKKVKIKTKIQKDIKLNDLSKKLALPLKEINDAISYLETNNLIIKKTTGYIVPNLQEQTLNKLYKPNLTMSPEKVADVKIKQEPRLLNILTMHIVKELWGLLGIMTLTYGSQNTILMTKL